MKKILLVSMIMGSTLWIGKLSLERRMPGYLLKESGEEENERESGADKQMAAWWWSRSYPEPTYVNEKFYKAWLHARAMKNPEMISGSSGVNGRNNTALFNGNWLAIGPDQNIGGRVLSIAINPSNSNNIFIGSAGGGIWTTNTGGVGANAWRPINTGYPVLGVPSILIDPSNPNTIYAGTGEVYRTDTSNIGFNVWKARGSYGIGILKSTDGGNSWRQIFNRNLSNLFGVQMLEFYPSNSTLIYACTSNGLYHSNDAGDNWTKILDKTYVSDVVIHPTDPDQLVAAVGNLENPDKGIYRSTNGGASWTKITSGLPASFDGFIHLDNVSTDPNAIVASIGRDAGSLNELYRSTDFGATWSVLSNSNHCQYQFWFAHDVAINPSNTNQLIMGGVPLYSYTISTSTRNSIGGVHADIHDIEFDPSNNNNVYIACDGGMYKSTNGGASFTMINGGLQAVQFYASFAVSPSNPDIMIGGLQDNGVVRYNGTGWNSVMGGDGGACAIHPTNNNIVFASNDARRLCRSTNGGSSFPSEVLSSWAFVADSRTGFMAPVAISKSNPSVVYVASDNLHKSTSGGVAGSWNDNSYSTATNYIEARHKTGIALAVSPIDDNKLYVSTSPFAQYDNDVNSLYVNAPPNLFKSTDGGTNFTNIKGSLPDRFVMDFAINPNNDDSVWIVLGGFGTLHVFVSGNGGLSWTPRGMGLPDVPHNAILLDPANSGIIYVGNDLGVYMSPDNGNTWYDFNNAFWDATLVMDLAATSNGKLVAATHGKGAFISDLYSARLPLTLISFTGKTSGNYNNLKWVTNIEDNVLQFELERSIDGGLYQKIATIQAKNSPGGSNYSFQDNISSIQSGEMVFYRLKMVDKDGKFDYSNIVNIKLTLASFLLVKGNPFTDNFKLVFTAKQDQNLTFNLYDVSGKLVVQKIYHARAGLNYLPWNNLTALPAGTYLLEMQSSDLRIARKLIKN